MAKASSLALPQLLLLLPLLLPPHLGAASQAVQVYVSSVVPGLLGEDVQLQCLLMPGEVNVQVSQVTWLRQDQTSSSVSIAVFHPTHGAGFPSTGPGEERLAFVAKTSPGSEFRDATLLIQKLKAEDEANYTCEFATFPGGNSKGTTWLRVLAEPKNHVEAHEVTLGPTPMTIATCVSSGGRPPAQIHWPSLPADQSNETRTIGPASDTFTVTSHLTLIPTAQMDEMEVTCQVEHETLKKPALLPVTLVVRYSPEVSISYDEDWYIGQEEASLNCDAQSNPKPTAYNWTTASGPLPSTAVSTGSKLMIHSVDWSVNTTFICQVTNAVGTGWAYRTIHVKETPASNAYVGQVMHIAVGIVVSVTVVTLIILGCCLLSRKCPGQGRQSYSPNVEVYYAPVDSTTSPRNLTENGMTGDFHQNDGQAPGISSARQESSLP